MPGVIVFPVRDVAVAGDLEGESVTEEAHPDPVTDARRDPAPAASPAPAEAGSSGPPAPDPDPVDPVPPAPVAPGQPTPPGDPYQASPQQGTPYPGSAGLPHPPAPYAAPPYPPAPATAAPHPIGGFPPGAPAPSPGPRPGPAAGYVPPPPREAVRPPRRVDAVPGTPFGLVQLDVPPVTSGLAVGSLLSGIASVLVSLLVVCFGLTGAEGGWGAWAAGAFAVLGGLLGGAALGLALLGMRQIRRVPPPPAMRFTGRGLAIGGLVCGAVGLAITALAFALAVFLQAG